MSWFQSVLPPSENAHVFAETVVVSTIVGLGKVWDKVVGHKKDNERKMLNKKITDHQADDVKAFNRLDTGLAVLDSKFDTVIQQLNTLDDRLYNQKLHGPYRKDS